MDPEALAQLPPEYLAEYNGRPVLVASWVTIFVTAVFTALRIYGRAFLKKGRSRGGGMIGRKKMLEWDDGKLILFLGSEILIGRNLY